MERKFWQSSAALMLLSLLDWSMAAAQDRALLDALWLLPDSADSSIQLQARTALESSASDVASLVSLIQAGPGYLASQPTGVVEAVRVDAQGRRFPYVLLVPESYDPDTAYPVDFMLHGGVGRPARPEGEPLWRGGYDQLRREDRLVVVPAGWADAYWWEDKQADNLAAILRRLKRDYHVDDNRVSLTGVSDGGTGAYFFAFKQPTDWSSFQPYIAHPAVLRNPQSRGGHWLFFENLLNKPLYIVNGEKDRLYPAESVEPFIELLDEIGVEHVFRVIENGGHNTQWLPEESPAIERFKAESVRDPLPDSLNWVTERSDRYNRNHWLLIDELSQPGRPGLFEVRREGNRFIASSDGVKRFTLLLSPDEVDFSQPIEVEVDGELVYTGAVEPSVSTLLDWLERDWDRSMLFTAALSIELD